jgi:hypothetical protein
LSSSDSLTLDIIEAVRPQVDTEVPEGRQRLGRPTRVGPWLGPAPSTRG